MGRPPPEGVDVDYPPPERGGGRLRAERRAERLCTVRFGEKAMFWMKFAVRTPGGHSAYPHVSKSANRIAAALIRDLESLESIASATPDKVARALARPGVGAGAERGLGKGGGGDPAEGHGERRRDARGASKSTCCPPRACSRWKCGCPPVSTARTSAPPSTASRRGALSGGELAGRAEPSGQRHVVRSVPAAPAGCGVRGWGRDGLGTGARGRARGR